MARPIVGQMPRAGWVLLLVVAELSMAQVPAGGPSNPSSGGSSGTVTTVTGDSHFAITNPTTTPNIVFSPQANDYAFSQISGLLGDSQLPADAVTYTASTTGVLPYWSATGVLRNTALTRASTTAIGSGTGFYLNRVTVPFNAGAPNFDFSLGNVFQVTLTANATGTTSNAAAINNATPFFVIEVCENGTGGFTWTWPSGFTQGFTMDTRPNVCVSQAFSWDGSSARPISAATYSAGQSTFFVSGVCQAAPSTNPASGDFFSWCDSTGLNFEMLNASGNKSGTAFAKTAVTAQALLSFDPTTGLFTQGGLQVAANPQTATYQVLASDFPATGCGEIPVASGTFTITLVASGSQPASGRCLFIINYGTGVVTVARSGQNINGAASNLTLSAGSASAPTGVLIISDATNYEAQTFGSSSSALSSITAATGANTIANGNNSAQIWNWALTSNADAFTFGETTAATSGTLGNQYIIEAETLAGSTAVPLGILSSLTGSQTLPTLHITPTWNTTGVVDAGILENVTNTASGTGSKLIDLQVGGTTEFNVDKTGLASATTGVQTGSSPPSCTPGTSGTICLAGGTAPVGVSSVSNIYADSTQVAAEVNNNNTGNMPISRVAAVNVTPVTVNTSTTNDQNLMAVSLNANLLNVAGRTFKIWLAGVYSNVVTAQPTVTLKIKLCTVSGCGSGTVITPISIASTVTSATAVTNLAANLTAYISTQTAGASSAYEAHGSLAIDLGTTNLTADSIFADTNTATVGTIDSTGALFLQAAVAFSGASASNSFTARQLIVEALN